jgi:hypothetical protein
MISVTGTYSAAHVKLDKRPIFVIAIESYARAFSTINVGSFTPSFPGSVSTPSYAWLTHIEDLEQTANDLDGNADLADLVFGVQDVNGQLTTDLASFVFEGKKVQLLQGYGIYDSTAPDQVALDPAFLMSDFVVLFTGKIDKVETDATNNEYLFTCPDIRQELSKVIFTTGNSGRPTDDNNPRTLTMHPLDALLYVLQTEVGLSASEIDVATITTYRDTLYQGAVFSWTIKSSPIAKDFIDNEIMKPLSAFHYINNLGQVCVNFAYPINLTTVLDLNVDNVTEIPTCGQVDMINQVEVRYDHNGDKFISQLVRQYAPSVSKYGLSGSPHIIESTGMQSSFGAGFLAALAAYMIFLRYGLKNLMFGDSGTSSTVISTTWQAALVEMGDFVTVTLPYVPNRVTGFMGIAGQSFIVLDRTWRFSEGKVDLKMVAVDLTIFKQFLVTPNGEAAYTLATAADQAKYLFQSDNTAHYSNGNSANTLA